MAKTSKQGAQKGAARMRVFRGEGGNAPSTGRTVTAYGTHYTPDRHLAERFGPVAEFEISPRAKIFDFNELRIESVRFHDGDTSENGIVKSAQDVLDTYDPEFVTNQLMELGYDGLVNENVGGIEYVIWNDGVVSRIRD
jgi:hypothetical protein